MARPVKFSKWRRLANAIAANASELPQLEAPGLRLGTMLRETEDVFDQQLTFAASKQESTLRLDELEAGGGHLAAYLAAGVREHYGRRSEKLTEFGLQPDRPRRTPQAVPPAPEEALATPADDPQP